MLSPARTIVRDIQLKVFQNLLAKIDVDRDWVTCISDFTRQEFCEYTGISNTSSLPEVVGGAGLMVDPRDEDALSQAMLDVLNNGRLRQELNRRETKRAAEFSWKKCADETIRVYEAAVAEHRQEKQ